MKASEIIPGELQCQISIDVAGLLVCCGIFIGVYDNDHDFVTMVLKVMKEHVDRAYSLPKLIFKFNEIAIEEREAQQTNAQANRVAQGKAA